MRLIIQPEPESSRLCDEGEQGLRVWAVDPVAARGAPGCRQDARGLIQPQSFPADAALGRHVTDQQPVSPHARSLNLPR
jgi:hypothetical protein